MLDIRFHYARFVGPHVYQFGKSDGLCASGGARTDLSFYHEESL